jgi:thiamine biosynthesis lipoprotein
MTLAPDTATHVRLHRHHAMGTEFLLYLDATELDATGERTLVQAVFDEVGRVEAIFSRFQPTSEISRLNQTAAEGPVVTDPEVFQMLTVAQSLWKMTGGAFDVALGKLSSAWGCATKSPQLPTTDALIQAQAASGMAQIVLDPEWRTVQFLTPGVELDLGAFAKGYAVDCALHVLATQGISALLNAGNSSIAASGGPFSSAWPIEVRSPQLPLAAPQTLARVLLHTNSMGSSGIMEQKLEQGGQTYSHLLDPRNRAADPREQARTAQVLQATVLAPTAALADALSTAMFVLGPEEGAAALASFPATAALWIVAEDGLPRSIEHHWPASCS